MSDAIVNNKKDNVAERSTEDMVLLAEKIKGLFIYAYSLYPDRDTLSQVAEDCRLKADRAMSAAPILGALGADPFKTETKWLIKYKRCKALVDLIDALHSTQEEMDKMDKGQIDYSEALTKMGL